MTLSVYIIFIVSSLLACAVGGVGAYLYIRTRHREDVVALEAMAQDLAEREESLHRLQNEGPHGHFRGGLQTEIEAKMDRMREALEHKNLEYNMLKQDFELETGMLRQELVELREEYSDIEGIKARAARETAVAEKKRRQVARLERKLLARAEQLEEDLNRKARLLENERSELAARFESEYANRTQRLAEREKEVDELAQRLELELSNSAEQREEHESAAADERRREMAALEYRHQRDLAMLKEEHQSIVTGIKEEHQALLARALEEREAALARTKEEQEEMLAKVLEKHRPELSMLAEQHEGELAKLKEEYQRDLTTMEERYQRELSARGEAQPLQVPAFDVGPVRTRSIETDRRPERTPDRGFESLTAIPGVNREMQSRLYAAGVTTLEQIARWGTADVKEMSIKLRVDREVIQNHWIIAAQSQLYVRSRTS